MSITKKRVALYLPLGKKGANWSGLGGAEKRLTFLISHISRDKFQPCVVFRIYGDNSVVYNSLSDYISEYCNVVFLRNDKEAFFHFMKEKYDYFLYDDCMVLAIPGVLGAVLGHSKRIMIFVTEYYARWSFRKRWHALIMKFNGWMASYIDCLYPSSATILERHFKKKRVSVTPCSLPRIEDYLLDENCYKNKTIVFASRLVEGKNPMLLIEAANQIRDILFAHNYKVLICGSGNLEQSLCDYIQQNNLESIVSCIGPQNMKYILPSAMIFCSLQDNENYPSQSLLEAIASGCICIATDNGNTRAIVKDEFGILINSSVESLSKAIVSVIEMSNEDRVNASLSAVKFAEENFKPDDAIKHYELLCSY